MYVDSFKLKWTFNANSVFLSSPVGAIDGTIYIGNNYGFIYSLNAQRSINWKYHVGSFVISTPAVVSSTTTITTPSSTLYVGAADSNIYAINQQGSLLWTYLTGDVVMSSPAVSTTDEVLYVGLNDHYLYSLYTRNIVDSAGASLSVAGSLK